MKLIYTCDCSLKVKVYDNSRKLSFLWEKELIIGQNEQFGHISDLKHLLLLQKWTSVQFLDNADFFREENHLFHNLSLLYVRMMLTQNAKKIDDNKKNVVHVYVTEL